MKHAAVGAALCLLVLAVYWPVYSFDFVNFDDDVYLLQNPRMAQGLSWDNVRWAFTTPYHSNWHPVTWLSYFLDAELFGLRPGAFHVVNVVVHALNAILLYAVLSLMTRRSLPSAIVAAFFAIHPVHVESVAWISERKDVLSMLFLLLSIGAYTLYTRKPNAIRYAAVLVLFATGLMAKPMLVTLPVALLLLDVWPLERMSRTAAVRLHIEKIPMLALAAGMSAVTLYVQQSSGAVRSTELVPLTFRVENAIVSYGAYLATLIWPASLAVFYPLPDQWPIGVLFLSAIVVASLSYAAWHFRRTLPYLFVGWFWFLLTLLPVIGIVQVGAQARADRYMYVPALGLYIAASWVLVHWMGNNPERRAIAAPSILGVVVLLSMVASSQVSYWRDSETLFRHAIAVTRDNYLAHNNLGVAVRGSDLGAAESHFREARTIKPDYRDARVNLANIYLESGREVFAIDEYLAALELSPTGSLVYENLALALVRAGRGNEAIATLHEAIRRSPGDAVLHLRLADALRESKRFEAAVGAYRRAIELDPESVSARCNLGVTLIALGDPKAAQRELRAALAIEATHIDTLYNLGVASAALNDVESAKRAFEDVLSIDPTHDLARRNLDTLVNN